LERLNFGSTARRKAGRKRILFRLWVVSMVWTVLGLPAPVAGDLFARFGHDEGPRRVARGIETSESAASMLRFRRGVFEVRPKVTETPTPAPDPTPTPTPTAAPAVAVAAPAGSVSEIIYAAAAEHGVDGAYLVSIASCESGLNPSATNPAGYYGLFQFSESTWGAYGYGSIFDPVAQARAAASMIAAGMASHWPNCA